MKFELKKFRQPLLAVGVVLILLVLWMYLDPLRMTPERIPDEIAEEVLLDRLRVTRPSFAFNYGLSIAGMFGSFLMAFVGAYFVGSEYRWRTWGGQMARSKRVDLITAKLLLLAAVSAAFVVVMMVLPLMASLLVSGVFLRLPVGTALASSDGAITRLPMQVATVWSSLMMWGAIASAFAIVFRSTLLGFLLPVALSYMDLLLGPLLGPLLALMPSSNQSTAFHAVFSYAPYAGIVAAPLFTLSVPLVQALAAIWVYIALAWGSSMLLFRRQEVS